MNFNYANIEKECKEWNKKVSCHFPPFFLIQQVIGLSEQAISIKMSAMHERASSMQTTTKKNENKF